MSSASLLHGPPRARSWSPEGGSKADLIRSWDAPKRDKWLANLTSEEALCLEYDHNFWARPRQLPPPMRYLCWLLMAGRGYGKTFAGSIWTINKAQQGVVGGRIALVGRTDDEAADVMVGGDSGILAKSPPWFKPRWYPSKSELHWPNGVVGVVLGAYNPDSFRGYNWGGAWCDEMASWVYPESFTQLKLGLRLGPAPQMIVTTTPKPVKHLRDLLDRRTTVLSNGTTYENLHNLAPTFADEILSEFSGTRIGAQELEGRLLTDVPGALWRRAQIDELRILRGSGDVGYWREQMRRIVVGVDPAAAASSQKSKSNNTGIIVCGLGKDEQYYVLEDATVHDKPHIWAAAVASAYHRWQADMVVAEVNQGGEMVESTIKVADPSIPVKSVHASRGKAVRAEPISMLYEQSKVHHVGAFPHLEDEMCTYDPLEWKPASGTSSSPDRMDAMVWAMTELTTGRKPPRNLNVGSTTIKRSNPYGGI